MSTDEQTGNETDFIDYQTIPENVVEAPKGWPYGSLVAAHEFQYSEKARRDLFAAAALSGYCSNDAFANASDERIASYVWDLADAMLEADE